MAEAELTLLPGFNPDGVQGLRIPLSTDAEIYAVPDRGLEVLDALVDGRAAMYRNPAGHRGRRSYTAHGRGPMRSIEAAFTAGPENVGAPEEGLPLHGTFSQTPARNWRRSLAGGAIGAVDCRHLVTGPRIVVERAVEPVDGKRAFRIVDSLEAEVASDYMWLYHPNFAVAEGAEFVCSERIVAPRPDGIAEYALDAYRTFTNVGGGSAAWPPAAGDPQAVRRENFETCFIMSVEPDQAGDVRAALIAPDRSSGAYVRWRPTDFQPSQQAFQLWRNPRDAVAGLEVGSTFFGWSTARRHGLLARLEPGEAHRYEIEIGFLKGAGEVDEFLARIDRTDRPDRRTLSLDELPALYTGKLD